MKPEYAIYDTPFLVYHSTNRRMSGWQRDI